MDRKERYHLRFENNWVVFREKLDVFLHSRAQIRARGGGPERQKKNRNEGPRVAIRDYRCPEMLINLVLTLGLLLVIKQPWILLKSPTLYSSLAAFYLSFLCACINPDTLAATGPYPSNLPITLKPMHRRIIITLYIVPSRNIFHLVKKIHCPFLL